MRIAIITGASSGMGREFVRQLHSYIQPDEIWAIARRKTALDSGFIIETGERNITLFHLDQQAFQNGCGGLGTNGMAANGNGFTEGLFCTGELHF